MGEGAEEEQGFVKADELVRIELKLCELGKEFGDEGGMVGIEAVFGGFQLGEQFVGIVLLRIMGSGRHGRRDSVTQMGDETMRDTGLTVTSNRRLVCSSNAAQNYERAVQEGWGAWRLAFAGARCGRGGQPLAVQGLETAQYGQW